MIQSVNPNEQKRFRLARFCHRRKQETGDRRQELQELQEFRRQKSGVIGAENLCGVMLLGEAKREAPAQAEAMLPWI